MSNHTPGPWKARFKESGVARSVVRDNDGGQAICSLPWPGPVDGGFAGRARHIAANARLIAAAPDLLRACQLVLAIHDNPQQQPPQYRISLDPKATEQIRAAIAKAEEE